MRTKTKGKWITTGRSLNHQILDLFCETLDNKQGQITTRMCTVKNEAQMGKNNSAQVQSIGTEEINLTYGKFN